MTSASRRRLSFGGVAELYDAARPSYPGALVDDVIAFATVAPPERILEVGSGTGKATALFAAKGFAVLGIEPSPEMAALARRNCAAHPGVRIEETDFERWQTPPGAFRLLFSAQAWHWVTPEIGYARARSALGDGGALAVFWNFPSWRDCESRDQLAEAYRRASYPRGPDDPMHPAAGTVSEFHGRFAEFAAAAGFASLERRSYHWSISYSTDEYIRLMRTHSTHIVLEDEIRRALLSEVAAVIDERGGSLTLPLVTRLYLAPAAG